MPDQQNPASGAHPEDPRKLDIPLDLRAVDWRYTLRSTLREFGEDGLTDLAAALTYFAVLSLFPALIALVSIGSLIGLRGSTITGLLGELAEHGVLPASAIETLTPVLDSVLQAPAPGVGLVVGIGTALWAASHYVKGFGRALNRIYGVTEGRPGWKLALQGLALTAVLLVLLTIAVALVASSGEVVAAIGEFVGMGAGFAGVWDAVRWLLLAVVVVVLVALLYWGTPNVRQPRIQWISVGAVVAIVLAALASAGFGLYLTTLGNASYAKTYGAFASVVVFLFWLWIMNTVLLLGGELDAELERARQLHAGIEAEEQIQLPPRDTVAAEKAEEKARADIQEGRRIRLRSPNSVGVNGGEPGSVADGVAADRVRRERAKDDAGR
nr:YihY/virulence factor BrkB family protein [Propionibacterium sp.]